MPDIITTQVVAAATDAIYIDAILPSAGKGDLKRSNHQERTCGQAAARVSTQVHKTPSCNFAISALLDLEHNISQTGNLTAKYAEGRGGEISG